MTQTDESKTIASYKSLSHLVAQADIHDQCQNKEVRKERLEYHLAINPKATQHRSIDSKGRVTISDDGYLRKVNHQWHRVKAQHGIHKILESEARLKRFNFKDRLIEMPNTCRIFESKKEYHLLQLERAYDLYGFAGPSIDPIISRQKNEPRVHPMESDPKSIHAFSMSLLATAIETKMLEYFFEDQKWSTEIIARHEGDIEFPPMILSRFGMPYLDSPNVALARLRHEMPFLRFRKFQKTLVDDVLAVAFKHGVLSFFEDHKNYRIFNRAHRGVLSFNKMVAEKVNGLVGRNLLDPEFEKEFEKIKEKGKKMTFPKAATIAAFSEYFLTQYQLDLADALSVLIDRVDISNQIFKLYSSYFEEYAVKSERQIEGLCNGFSDILESPLLSWSALQSVQDAPSFYGYVDSQCQSESSKLFRENIKDVVKGLGTSSLVLGAIAGAPVLVLGGAVTWAAMASSEVASAYTNLLIEDAIMLGNKNYDRSSRVGESQKHLVNAFSSLAGGFWFRRTVNQVSQVGTKYGFSKKFVEGLRTSMSKEKRVAFGSSLAFFGASVGFDAKYYFDKGENPFEKTQFYQNTLQALVGAVTMGKILFRTNHKNPFIKALVNARDSALYMGALNLGIQEYFYLNFNKGISEKFSKFEMMNRVAMTGERLVTFAALGLIKNPLLMTSMIYADRLRGSYVGPNMRNKFLDSRGEYDDFLRSWVDSHVDALDIVGSSFTSTGQKLANIYNSCEVGAISHKESMFTSSQERREIREMCSQLILDVMMP